MKINPNSELFEDEKKATSAQTGTPLEEVDVQDDATKFMDATGATEDETQALEDSGATVIVLSDSFKTLMNVVADVIEMFANAADELAQFVTSVTDSDDATEGFEETLQLAIDFIVDVTEVVIEACVAIYGFYNSNKDTIEVLVGLIKILAGVTLQILSLVAPVHILTAAFGALYYVIKAVWALLQPDIS